MKFKVGDIICYSHGQKEEVFKDVICSEVINGVEYFYGLWEERNSKSVRHKNIDDLFEEYSNYEEVYVIHDDVKYVIKTFENIIDNLDKYPKVLERRIFDTFIYIIYVDNKLYYIEKHEDTYFYKHLK